MKEEIKIKVIRRSKKSKIEGKEIILSNNDFIKYKMPTCLRIIRFVTKFETQSDIEKRFIFVKSK